MEGITREDFERMKQTASEKVLEMHRDSKHRHMPPFPDFVTRPDRREDSHRQTDAQPHGDSPGGTAPRHAKTEPASDISGRVRQILPYVNLSALTQNKDALLLLGLILLLSGDKADEKLILALAYILL